MTKANPSYRLADKYGRQIGERHETFSEALAARSEGAHIERLDKSCRWAPATCAIRVVNVGQRFATAAQLVSGRELVAETDPVAFGFTAAARSAALALAARIGVDVG